MDEPVIIPKEEHPQPEPKRKRGRQKGDIQTYYTPRQKANAMLAAETVGAAKASRQLGIPLNTIINWKKRKKGVQRDTEAIYDRNRKKLANKAQKVAEANLNELLKPEKLANASVMENAKAFETAVTKAELLMGNPTSRNGQEGMSDESFVERVCALATRIKQRLGQDDGGGEVRVQEPCLLPAPETIVGAVSELPTGSSV